MREKSGIAGDRDLADELLWRFSTGSMIRHSIPRQSCTHLTTETNGVVVPIHDRMPQVSPGSAINLWLDIESKELRILQPLPVPFPSVKWR